MSTPLNQNEGARIPNPQVLDIENSQLKNEFSTSFHNLGPSMGQALLKEVAKRKEWPHFSGEGEYDHMEFIRGIDMIKEDFELPDRLVTARFNTLLTKSAHRWFKLETAFESAKFNADKDKALPWFCQQKDRLTALYPDMSEFMIHRKILRQCGEEDIINILEEVTTRTKIGSSRLNLKTRFNTPWKDSVDKNPKENSNNSKYKFAYTIRKCHICQSTTHLSNTCPKRGKINEIDIEKEPDFEKDDICEDNSDDKSSICSESSKDIENINASFDIMESSSHFPQLSNDQLDLSQVQDAQLMKTKPNRGKGYTAGNSCITEVVIDYKTTKLLLHPGAFCSCVGKSFLKTCVQNFEDQLLLIDGIKFNSANLQNNKDRYFTIRDNKCQKFAFLPFKRQITVNKVSPISLELEKFKSEQLNEAEISLNLSDKQENELSALLYDHKEAFASDKEPIGAIMGHEVDIILNIERPYPPLLRRHAYPESPKSREALEIHIKELLDLGVIRKVGHNEEVEITTPVIVAWHNGRYRMVGGFRALNIYTVPDRYPIPKIQIALTQISQAVYISTMDALKGFYQNVVTPRARKYLRIIVHCGVYEYLRMPFGIKNAPSHFQRMMNEIFPEELSEGWLIIYIDDIIVCSKT
ncbi:hypothetical protein O181_085525 [Austropuccinia psidii MF-1]|uniref:Reverse transcriptase domain-containing protein n=1 Tax=Austropuccinia psidii MF-1 TaxID=1389203 RepID=A0A9Q3FXP8_9BASI|nr:hypothetical protein [Austropuccinia psidii MF-1]